MHKPNDVNGYPLYPSAKPANRLAPSLFTRSSSKPFPANSFNLSFDPVSNRVQHFHLKLTGEDRCVFCGISESSWERLPICPRAYTSAARMLNPQHDEPIVVNELHAFVKVVLLFGTIVGLIILAFYK
jgi:hypothetical protein